MNSKKNQRSNPLPGGNGQITFNVGKARDIRLKLVKSDESPRLGEAATLDERTIKPLETASRSHSNTRKSGVTTPVLTYTALTPKQQQLNTDFYRNESLLQDRDTIEKVQGHLRRSAALSSETPVNHP